MNKAHEEQTVHLLVCFETKYYRPQTTRFVRQVLTIAPQIY